MATMPSVSSFSAACVPCWASQASSWATAWSMRPLMPPAELMSSIASSPALRIADPGSAYGPVNATLITPPAPPVLELPHAPMTNTASVARLVARSRRLIIDNLHFVSAARACVCAPQSRPAALFPIVFRGESAPAAGDYSIDRGSVSDRPWRLSSKVRSMSRLWLQAGRFVIARRVAHGDWIGGTSSARDLDRPGHEPQGLRGH